MFGNYLGRIRGLMEIRRYQTSIMHNKRTVAEHSWFVAQVAQGLAMWEKYKFGSDVSIEKVWFMANKHDEVEVFTGDIPSYAKDLTPNFRNELHDGESRIYKEDIVPMLPNSWRQMYIDMHNELSKRETLEAKLVKAGDLIDRLFECMEEIELGNKKRTEKILAEDLKSLYKLDLMSVKYFMKYSIKDIDGAYEYIAEDIRKQLDGMDFSEYF